MQPGVAGEAIKGAALVGAALGVMTTKGVVVTSAASLSAAYVAISQGVLGDVFRTLGGITWDVTEAATILYQKATANEKSAGMSKELADKVMAAVATSKSRAEQAEAVGQRTSTAYLEEDYEDYEHPEAELSRVLKEAESAISAADAAIAAADKTLGNDDDDFDDLEAEAAKLEEEARLAEEEESLLSEEDRLAEEARLREELLVAQEQVRLEEERLAAEKQSEESLETEETYDQEWEDAVALAQEGLEGKIVGIDDAITDESAKNQWAAAGALAQELQDGPYDEFEDDESQLVENVEPVFVADATAEDIQDSDDDDVFIVDDEMDMEALAKAAREAVDIYEQQAKASSETKQEKRDEWANAMVLDEDDDEYEDSDLAAAEEMLPGGDLLDVALAAREAVARMGDEAEEIDEDEDSFEFFEDDIVASQGPSAPVLRDWSVLTVARLKEELRSRGLKSYGKKVELIKLLEDYDAAEMGVLDDDDDDANEQKTQTEESVQVDKEEDVLEFSAADLAELGRQARAAVDAYDGEEAEDDSEDWFEEFEDGVDLEELGKQARAAVAASFADEPSDEVLKQLEIEEPLLFKDAGSASTDYASMTVVELKEELRSKGLRISGRKAELVERLRSS
jgi:hypothetical protein